MLAFEKALIKLLEHEVKYSAYSASKGGESYCGISRAYFGKWEGWQVIDSYEDKRDIVHGELEEAVSNFYYVYFWMKMGCHLIHNDFIANLIFNMSIQLGKKQCSKKALRVLGLHDNTAFNPAAIDAINQMDSKMFVLHYILEVVEFYTQLGVKKNEAAIKHALSFYYQHDRQ